MNIRCYKTFTQPLAIGFDLDDTLYDNAPVLRLAEQKLQQFLHLHHPKTRQYDSNHWFDLRQQVIAHTPALINDTSAARKAALTLGFTQLGYNFMDTEQAAQAAFEEFHYWRNQITISDDIHRLLAQLKQKFRLFVISNGNADVDKIGLSQYFEFTLHPSPEIAMKPATDLFSAAQHHLALAPQQICYVGDHPVSDVVGANQAQWQSVWLNSHNVRLNHNKKPLQLPTLEITSILALSAMLK